MPKADGRKRIVLLLLGLAAVFLVGRAWRLWRPLDADKEALYLGLQRDAAELNATLPEMVSEFVRLDRATSGPGNAFNYVMTVTDDAAARSIAADPRKMHDLRAQLHGRVCAMMPVYRDRGTIVSYWLKDNAGAGIAEIAINPEDCSYADKRL